jgi:hypothetical protein
MNNSPAFRSSSPATFDSELLINAGDVETGTGTTT